MRNTDGTLNKFWLDYFRDWLQGKITFQLFLHFIFFSTAKTNETNVVSWRFPPFGGVAHLSRRWDNTKKL